MGSFHPTLLICLRLCLADAISHRATTLSVMLCNVCKDGLEGMWDPSRSKRLGLLKDFLDDNSDVDNDDNSDDNNRGLHNSCKH